MLRIAVPALLLCLAAAPPWWQAEPLRIVDITSSLTRIDSIEPGPLASYDDQSVFKSQRRPDVNEFTVVNAYTQFHWRGEGGFNSLDDVRAMFAVPGALTAGWVHYLAFDLFVGTWIAERSARLGLGHPWVIPLLLMTFLFGPLGLLAFVLLRALRDPTSLKWQPGASS